MKKIWFVVMMLLVAEWRQLAAKLAGRHTVLP